TFVLLFLCHVILSLFVLFFLMIRRPPRSTLFPTRRSSDLMALRYHFTGTVTAEVTMTRGKPLPVGPVVRLPDAVASWEHYSDLTDRKSTRLNSSHVEISYAVFCLKKKNKQNIRQD